MADFAHYGSVLDSLGEGVAVIDREGTIVLVNQEWGHSIANDGGLPEPHPGSNFLDDCRAGDATAARALQGISAVIRGDVSRFELAYSGHAHEQHEFQLHCAPLNAVPSAYFVLTHRDMGSARGGATEPGSMPTSGPQSSALNAHLEGEWARCRRNGLRLSMMAVALDAFDAAVERFGRDGAEAYLQRIEQALGRFAGRAGDRVARLDDAVFVIVMAQTDIVDTYYRALEIKRAISAIDVGAGQSKRLTASIGISSAIPTPERSPSHLLENARSALARARRLGHNRVELSLQEVAALPLRTRPHGKG
ncbi:sensor domain-containing diguanylate cyclase [Paludibacterium yongneupense]|uniref:sensor domain-containing diguanylate cyclase n=1 Tax=Paludibacterium yongneupense TaxID=400061 RepID=UPI00040F997B|nr:sensor domain-containing diguanylate cyclase [Paludibacterium yongneupense]